MPGVSPATQTMCVETCTPFYNVIIHNSFHARGNISFRFFGEEPDLQVLYMVHSFFKPLLRAYINYTNFNSCYRDTGRTGIVSASADNCISFMICDYKIRIYFDFLHHFAKNVLIMRKASTRLRELYFPEKI